MNWGRAAGWRPGQAQTFARVINVHVLTSVTFIYDTREDRILTAVNASHPGAWSCWLDQRRLALALLEHAAKHLSSTSALAQRAPADFRGEFVAFERDAAIAKTAGAMSNTPADVLKSSTTGAELAERLTISNQEIESASSCMDKAEEARSGSAHAGQGSAHLADATGFSASCRCYRLRLPRPAGWLPGRRSLNLPRRPTQSARSLFCTDVVDIPDRLKICHWGIPYCIA